LRDGEVCAACNNGLAHLDQALVHDLEVYAMLAGVPRKGGRPPKISSYGNMRADVQDGHCRYYFNMESKPVVTETGTHLPGYRGRERDIKADLTVDGNAVMITFPVEFGRSPKVARALVKLGAEYLCWAKGRDCAADVLAGEIANYVVNGNGYRPVILFGGDRSRYEHRFEHIGKVDGSGWYCCFRIAHFSIMIDLTPDLSAFRRMAAHLHESLGSSGWTTLPLDAVSEVDGKLVLRV
jgi:hypothetical protein